MHRIVGHPRPEPRLCIRGMEIGASVLRVRTPLTRDEIMLANADSFVVNGTSTTKHALLDSLCAARACTFDIVLSHGHASRNFKVDVRIPEQADLGGVEAAVFRLVESRRLDRRSIDLLISDCRQFATASEYCSGIVEYLYGVLARERSEETRYGFDDHEMLFNRSSESLQGIERPIAREIRAIIAFTNNHFLPAAKESAESRIGIAARRFLDFTPMARAHAAPPHQYSEAISHEAFTDLDTERLIRWSELPDAKRTDEIPELERAFISLPSSYDRTKVAVLIASAARVSGDGDLVKRYARHLRESPLFGAWAARTLQQLA